MNIIKEEKMKTDNFYRCFDFIVYALKAGKIRQCFYKNNYLRKALFELSEQGYICFCYTKSLKHKFVILDKEIFNEVFRE